MNDTSTSSRTFLLKCATMFEKDATRDARQRDTWWECVDVTIEMAPEVKKKDECTLPRWCWSVTAVRTHKTGKIDRSHWHVGTVVVINNNVLKSKDESSD